MKKMLLLVPALALLLVPSWGCTSGLGRSEMVSVVERGPASIPCSRVSKMELAGAAQRSRRGSRRVLSGDCASCVENSVACVSEAFPSDFLRTVPTARPIRTVLTRSWRHPT